MVTHPLLPCSLTAVKVVHFDKHPFSPFFPSLHLTLSTYRLTTSRPPPSLDRLAKDGHSIKPVDSRISHNTSEKSVQDMSLQRPFTRGIGRHWRVVLWILLSIWYLQLVLASPLPQDSTDLGTSNDTPVDYPANDTSLVDPFSTPDYLGN